MGNAIANVLVASRMHGATFSEHLRSCFLSTGKDGITGLILFLKTAFVAFWRAVCIERCLYGSGRGSFLRFYKQLVALLCYLPQAVATNWLQVA